MHKNHSGYSIFKACELDAYATGWIVEFHAGEHVAGVVDADMRWPFRTRRAAREFVNRVKSGEDYRTAYHYVKD